MMASLGDHSDRKMGLHRAFLPTSSASSVASQRNHEQFLDTDRESRKESSHQGMVAYKNEEEGSDASSHSSECTNPELDRKLNHYFPSSDEDSGTDDADREDPSVRYFPRSCPRKGGSRRTSFSRESQHDALQHLFTQQDTTQESANRTCSFHHQPRPPGGSEYAAVVAANHGSNFEVICSRAAAQHQFVQLRNHRRSFPSSPSFFDQVQPSVDFDQDDFPSRPATRRRSLGPGNLRASVPTDPGQPRSYRYFQQQNEKPRPTSIWLEEARRKNTIKELQRRKAMQAMNNTATKANKEFGSNFDDEDVKQEHTPQSPKLGFKKSRTYSTVDSPYCRQKFFPTDDEDVADDRSIDSLDSEELADLEFTRRARLIQDDLRVQEMEELAIEAERAADEGKDKFVGNATRFGVEHSPISTPRYSEGAAAVDVSGWELHDMFSKPRYTDSTAAVAVEGWGPTNDTDSKSRYDKSSRGPHAATFRSLDDAKHPFDRMQISQVSPHYIWNRTFSKVDNPTCSSPDESRSVMNDSKHLSDRMRISQVSPHYTWNRTISEGDSSTQSSPVAPSPALQLNRTTSLPEVSPALPEKPATVLSRSVSETPRMVHRRRSSMLSQAQSVSSILSRPHTPYMATPLSSFREKKIRVMALRHISEVFPPFGEMHQHLRTHLARGGVSEVELLGGKEAEIATSAINTDNEDNTTEYAPGIAGSKGGNSAGSFTSSFLRNSPTLNSMPVLQSLSTFVMSVANNGSDVKPLTDRTSKTEVLNDFSTLDSSATYGDNDFSSSRAKDPMGCRNDINCGIGSTIEGEQERSVVLTSRHGDQFFKHGVVEDLAEDESCCSSSSDDLDLFVSALASELHFPKKSRKLSTVSLPLIPSYFFDDDDDDENSSADTRPRIECPSPVSPWMKIWETFSPPPRRPTLTPISLPELGCATMSPVIGRPNLTRKSLSRIAPPPLQSSSVDFNLTLNHPGVSWGLFDDDKLSTPLKSTARSIAGSSAGYEFGKQRRPFGSFATSFLQGTVPLISLLQRECSATSIPEDYDECDFVDPFTLSSEGATEEIPRSLSPNSSQMISLTESCNTSNSLAAKLGTVRHYDVASIDNLDCDGEPNVLSATSAVRSSALAVQTARSTKALKSITPLGPSVKKCREGTYNLRSLDDKSDEGKQPHEFTEKKPTRGDYSIKTLSIACSPCSLKQNDEVKKKLQSDHSLDSDTILPPNNKKESSGDELCHSDDSARLGVRKLLLDDEAAFVICSRHEQPIVAGCEGIDTITVDCVHDTNAAVFAMSATRSGDTTIITNGPECTSDHDDSNSATFCMSKSPDTENLTKAHSDLKELLRRDCPSTCNDLSAVKASTLSFDNSDGPDIGGDCTNPSVIKASTLSFDNCRTGVVLTERNLERNNNLLALREELNLDNLPMSKVDERFFSDKKSADNQVAQLDLHVDDLERREDNELGAQGSENSSSNPQSPSSRFTMEESPSSQGKELTKTTPFQYHADELSPELGFVFQTEVSYGSDVDKAMERDTGVITKANDLSISNSKNSTRLSLSFSDTKATVVNENSLEIGSQRKFLVDIANSDAMCLSTLPQHRRRQRRSAVSNDMTSMPMCETFPINRSPGELTKAVIQSHVASLSLNANTSSKITAIEEGVRDASDLPSATFGSVLNAGFLLSEKKEPSADLIPPDLQSPNFTKRSSIRSTGDLLPDLCSDEMKIRSLPTIGTESREEESVRLKEANCSDKKSSQEDVLSNLDRCCESTSILIHNLDRERSTVSLSVATNHSVNCWNYPFDYDQRPSSLLEEKIQVSGNACAAKASCAESSNATEKVDHGPKSLPSSVPESKSTVQNSVLQNDNSNRPLSLFMKSQSSEEPYDKSLNLSNFGNDGLAIANTAHSQNAMAAAVESLKKVLVCQMRHPQERFRSLFLSSYVDILSMTIPSTFLTQSKILPIHTLAQTKPCCLISTLTPTPELVTRTIQPGIQFTRHLNSSSVPLIKPLTSTEFDVSHVNAFSSRNQQPLTMSAESVVVSDIGKITVVTIENLLSIETQSSPSDTDLTSSALLERSHHGNVCGTIFSSNEKDRFEESVHPSTVNTETRNSCFCNELQCGDNAIYINPDGVSASKIIRQESTLLALHHDTALGIKDSSSKEKSVEKSGLVISKPSIESDFESRDAVFCNELRCGDAINSASTHEEITTVNADINEDEKTSTTNIFSNVLKSETLQETMSPDRVSSYISRIGPFFTGEEVKRSVTYQEDVAFVSNYFYSNQQSTFGTDMETSDVNMKVEFEPSMDTGRLCEGAGDQCAALSAYVGCAYFTTGVVDAAIEMLPIAHADPASSSFNLDSKNTSSSETWLKEALTRCTGRSYQNGVNVRGRVFRAPSLKVKKGALLSDIDTSMLQNEYDDDDMAPNSDNFFPTKTSNRRFSSRGRPPLLSEWENSFRCPPPMDFYASTPLSDKRDLPSFIPSIDEGNEYNEERFYKQSADDEPFQTSNLDCLTNPLGRGLHNRKRIVHACESIMSCSDGENSVSGEDAAVAHRSRSHQSFH